MRRLTSPVSRMTMIGTALALLIGMSANRIAVRAQEAAADPPEVTLGERLFLETRFAQSFQQFLSGGARVNDSWSTGDLVMDKTMTTDAPFPGPFAGRAMNCRACHLVDEHVETPKGTMRAYADFARRSPVPSRADGMTTAPRNSPSLVNATLPRKQGLLLHFDAEFATTADLVRDTFTGRNFGWLPGERRLAIAHIARIIRQDDGNGDLAKEFGGFPYSVVLTGSDPAIPHEFRLPEEFRVNVMTASDETIFHAVSKLVVAYTESLAFSQDERGAFNLSPYDAFLEQNGLPRKPAEQESDLEYSRRLLSLIERLERGNGLSWLAHTSSRSEKRHHRRIRFVKRNPATEDGNFTFHDQPFAFGAEELRGLKIFFAESHRGFDASEKAAGTVGNCITCHQAPVFTDFRLHNTGTTQVEYDRIHGRGTFAHLHIPDLRERNANHDQYLPATEQHPNAQGPFRAVPSAGNPRLTDLGLWNILANPDFPTPQRRIRRTLCLDTATAGFAELNIQSTLREETLDRLIESAPFAERCSPSALLPHSIALFKTPGLRDLGHSAPYMHNGQFDTLEEIINFYREVSDFQRAGRLRNGDPELGGIRLTEPDIRPLAAFLKSLNEDYE